VENMYNFKKLFASLPLQEEAFTCEPEGKEE
jgi:hypothetical protein